MNVTFHHLLVFAHVLSGAVALLAGTIAIIARKGASIHVNFGHAFAYTMIVSSALGAALGLLKPDQFYITFHAGVLGITLIASSWIAARKSTEERALAENALSIINLINTLCLIVFGIYALQQTDGALLGFAGEDYLFLAFMAGIAAISDISLWRRIAISNHHRVARHLWRMCFGFFITAGSAFTGPGGKAFPEAIQDSGILSLPELLIFLAMLFWLCRVLFTKFVKPSPEVAAR